MSAFNSGTFLIKPLTSLVPIRSCLGSVAVYHAGLSNQIPFFAKERSLKTPKKPLGEQFNQKFNADNYRTPVTRVQIPAQALRETDTHHGCVSS